MATKRKYHDGPAVIFSMREARPARAMAELISLGLRARGFPKLADEIRALGVSLTGIVDALPSDVPDEKPKAKK